MAGPVDPRLLKRARATRGYLVASVVTGVVSSILIIAQAWLIARAVVDVFNTGQIPDQWPQLLGGILAVFALRGALGWVNSWLAVRASAEVKSQLRRDVVAARLHHPMGSASSATTATVATSGLDSLDGYFAKYLPQLVLAATVPFIVGITVLVIDWGSAFIIAFTLPLIPVFMVLIGYTTRDQTDRNFAVSDRLANRFADLIAGLPTLQAFARARAQRHGIEINEEQYRQSTMKVLYISFLSSFALELLASLSVAIVAVTVGLRLAYGQMDFFDGLLVLILAPEAYLPVRMVGTHFHDSADGVAAADAAFQIIEEAEAVAPGGAGPETSANPANTLRPVPSPTQVPVRLDHVSFTYPGADTPALANFSLTIAPGEVVALKGISGGGKSTALALLMGFLTPDQGRVLVGGNDLRELDLEQWRRHIAWVAQEPGLQHGTVGHNVGWGAPLATHAEIQAALHRAGADFGANKPVGDEGEGLSGGERRRVAVARALLRIQRGAGLMILDEPTAGLDAETERAVIEAVRAAGVSVLAVTHRQAVLNAADRVVTVKAPVRV